MPDAPKTVRRVRVHDAEGTGTGPRDVDRETPAGIPWVAAPDIAIDRDGPDVAFHPFDPVSGPETPIRNLLAAQAGAAPDDLAVQDDESRLTYPALMDQANRLAAVIAAVVPAGQPVGIRLHDTASGPVAITCLRSRGDSGRVARPRRPARAPCDDCDSQPAGRDRHR